MTPCGAGWQLVEEFIDDDYQASAGINRQMAYVWGLRYIDNLLCHREDAGGDENYTRSLTEVSLRPN